MIFAKCRELKKMIARYNRLQYSEENWLHYEFYMFSDGDWACLIKCDGVVNVRHFRPIFDYVSTFYVDPFMWGNEYGFRLHIQ